MTDKKDVIYVDLIEDEPKSFKDFTHEDFDECKTSDSESIEALKSDYEKYLANFQPFRWHAENAGNHEIGAWGERYFNKADAKSNIRQQYSQDTVVYLRQEQQGDELLRMAYPNDLGGEILLGPDVVATPDKTLISWEGSNYIRTDLVPPVQLPEPKTLAGGVKIIKENDV